MMMVRRETTRRRRGRRSRERSSGPNASIRHCNGDTHRMAVTDHERKKDGKQVNNRKNISFFFNFQISFFYLEKERSAGCILVW